MEQKLLAENLKKNMEQTLSSSKGGNRINVLCLAHYTGCKQYLVNFTCLLGLDLHQTS